MYKVFVFILSNAFLYSCVNTQETNNIAIDENITRVENKTLDATFVFDYEENENLDSIYYEYYHKCISENLIGKKQLNKLDNNNKSTKIYLGTIYCSNVDLYYDVITQFDLIKMAIDYRGKSKLIFLGKSRKTCRIYELDMPDELPVLIKNNELIIINESDTISKSMEDGLFPIF